MGTHEEQKELLAAYALGALDDTEARELNAHLAECTECAAELTLERDTAAMLAHSVPLTEPPTDLRGRVLDAIRVDGGRQGASVHPGGPTEWKEDSRSGSNVISFTRPPRATWPTALKVTAIAASIAFLGLAISLIALWSRYSTLKREVAGITSRLNDAQRELATERETLAREREAISLMTGPDAYMATLAGTEMATEAHAKFVLDRKSGRAMLMAYNLPAAPAGKAYQLWYIAEGKAPMPGHVFTPDPSGRAEMSDQVPAEARQANVFAVTLEPQTGMKEPTGPKFLLSAS